MALAQLADLSDLAVTVSACGENSLRVRIAPTTPPPAVVATADALRHRLAADNLTELPGAFLPDCGGQVHSEPRSIAPGAPPAINGNLRATRTESGTLAFTAVDSNATLFSAIAMFGIPTLATSCAAGALDRGNDLRVANMTLADAISWCAANTSCAGFTAAAAAGLECGGDQRDSSEGGIQDGIKDGIQDEIHHFYFKLSGAGGNGDPTWRTWLKPPAGYLSARLSMVAGDKQERIFGLGQGNWTAGGGCPSGEQRVVPLERNGQSVTLRQQKFHVSIPFAYSRLATPGLPSLLPLPPQPPPPLPPPPWLPPFLVFPWKPARSPDPLSPDPRSPDPLSPDPLS